MATAKMAIGKTVTCEADSLDMAKPETATVSVANGKMANKADRNTAKATANIATAKTAKATANRATGKTATATAGTTPAIALKAKARIPPGQHKMILKYHACGNGAENGHVHASVASVTVTATRQPSMQGLLHEVTMR
jgi:hypothetical protein